MTNFFCDTFSQQFFCGLGDLELNDLDLDLDRLDLDLLLDDLDLDLDLDDEYDLDLERLVLLIDF